jgi:hypothetical protein
LVEEEKWREQSSIFTSHLDEFETARSKVLDWEETALGIQLTREELTAYHKDKADLQDKYRRLAAISKQLREVYYKARLEEELSSSSLRQLPALNTTHD